jgi:hypothetical protein
MGTITAAVFGATLCTVVARDSIVVCVDQTLTGRACGSSDAARWNAPRAKVVVIVRLAASGSMLSCVRP